MLEAYGPRRRTAVGRGTDRREPPADSGGLRHRRRRPGRRRSPSPPCSAARAGRRALSQRLTALGTRLGIDPPADDHNIETALSYLEQVTGAATEAVAESSADAIRLRRSLDTLPQGVVICDENGTVVYRNGRANTLMTSRHGDALAAQAVTELLEDAWRGGTAERTVDLYGPPRRTLTVRAHQIDDGRRPLGVIAMIEDVSERRRLEEIRRDFVANVSHELEDADGRARPARRDARQRAGRRGLAPAGQSHPHRGLPGQPDHRRPARPEPDRVRGGAAARAGARQPRHGRRRRTGPGAADQRGITITLSEPHPPVAVLGDRRQLVSAMHALLENAVTYSYDGTAVTVSGTVVAEGLDVAEPLAAVATVSPAATATIGSGQLSLGLGVPPLRPPRRPARAASVVRERTPIRWPSPSIDAGRTGESGGLVAKPGGWVSPAAAAGTVEATPAGNGYDGRATGVDGEPASLGGPEPAARPVARETVRLAVADHGVGIPARDLDRIFERFYRVDHGRSRDTGGTGLGLSIVRHVANNHQGWVDVESREGEGSTFTLVLPLQPERMS